MGKGERQGEPGATSLKKKESGSLNKKKILIKVVLFRKKEGIVSRGVVRSSEGRKKVFYLLEG